VPVLLAARVTNGSVAARIYISRSKFIRSCGLKGGKDCYKGTRGCIISSKCKRRDAARREPWLAFYNDYYHCMSKLSRKNASFRRLLLQRRAKKWLAFRRECYYIFLYANNARSIIPYEIWNFKNNEKLLKNVSENTCEM